MDSQQQYSLNTSWVFFCSSSDLWILDSFKRHKITEGSLHHVKLEGGHLDHLLPVKLLWNWVYLWSQMCSNCIPVCVKLWHAYKPNSDFRFSPFIGNRWMCLEVQHYIYSRKFLVTCQMATDIWLKLGTSQNPFLFLSILLTS